jgi:hypothetical protein
MSAVAVPVTSSSWGSRRSLVRRTVAVAAGAVVLGVAAGMLASSGKAADAVVLAVVLLPVALWWRPQLGPVVIFGVALLIEQFPLNLMNNNQIGMEVPITNSIPMFQGLGSLHVEPADLLLVAVFVIYMLHSADDAGRWWPRTQLSVAVTGLVGVTLLALILGATHHGDTRESMQECRPFLYLAATYLAASVMIRSRSAIQAMLWALVVAEAIKACQGVYVWSQTRHFVPEPQNILTHEEALFESLFFFTVIALWMFGLRGRLRTVATALVPLVLFCDLVNDRRTAWMILAAGFVVLMAVGYRALPNRRRTIVRIVACVTLVSAVYFPAFWNSQGTFGKVAAAFRSQIGTPTTRDALSDEYRVQEDANLELNMRQAGLIGQGFGTKIDYALPMPGMVATVDPEINYIPHNTMLYILWRMGLLGGIAFWALIGAGVIAGCRLARCVEPELAAIGAIAAAAVVGWSLQGATDQGFTLYRPMFVIGCLLGVTEAARRLYAQETVPRMR